MTYSITEPLSEYDLEALAEIMADNPEVWNKLADAIADKVGDRLYERGWSISGIEERLDKIDSKLTDHDSRFDTLESKFQSFGERQEEFSRVLGKVSGRLNTIDGRLGITTDTRRQA